MSDSRKPQISQVSTTLSERIAALQRKSSSNNRDADPVRSTTPLGSAPSSPSRSFSAGAGPRAPTTPDGSGGFSASQSPRSVSSLHPSSAAVRDRIARFQTSSADADEKPLVPRSSFGAPAPNPELLTVRKAYPGAAGSGTGSWGEGVLRPQQTGGTWGPGQSGGLKAQLTGGAWAAAATAREYTATNGARWGQRAASGEESPVVGRGKDAFAELDDDAARARARTTSGNGTFPSPSFSRLSVDDAPAGSSSNHAQAGEESVSLPSLPDAPNTPVTDRPGTSAPVDLATVQEDVTVPTFPSAPIGLGPPPLRSQGVPDGGPVEIGVNSPKPGGFEALQRRVSQGLMGDEEDVFGPTHSVDTSLVHDPSLDLPSRAGVERTDSGRVDPTDPAAHEVRGPELLVPRDEVAEKDATAVANSVVGDDEGSLAGTSISAADVARYRAGGAVGGAGREDATNGRLPRRTDSVDDDSRALDASESPLRDTPSSSSSRRNNPNGRSSHARENTSGTSASVSVSATQRSTPASSPSSSRPTSPPSAIGSRGAAGTASSAAEAASRAREAIALGRTKSQQKIKRLPPGRTLSAAEMDASDDDYEPGWASVISRTN